jgi:hypothetical protein
MQGKRRFNAKGDLVVASPEKMKVKGFDNPYPQVPESVQNHPHFAGLDDADRAALNHAMDGDPGFRAAIEGDLDLLRAWKDLGHDNWKNAWEGNLIAELIMDSNPRQPLSQVNARWILNDLAPPGFYPKKVAGQGGAGADLGFEGPNQSIFKIEVKSTMSFRGFDDELSHAAQNQAQGHLVVVQVPVGENANNWMRRFWGNRKSLISGVTPSDISKMEVYKNTEIIIVDVNGDIKVPRQSIYNPPK